MPRREMPVAAAAGISPNLLEPRPPWRYIARELVEPLYGGITSFWKQGSSLMPRPLAGLLAVIILLSQSLLPAQVAPVPEARYLPEQTVFGLVVRPSMLLQNPELQKLYKLAQTLPRALPESELGTEFSNLDVAVVGMTMPAASLQAGGGPGVPVVMLRTKDAASLKAITAKAIRPDLQKRVLPGTTTEALVDPKPRPQFGGMGKKLDRPITTEEAKELDAKAEAAAQDPDAWKVSDAFVLPDERTMLFSQHGAELVTVLNQVKPGAAAPAWAKQYEPATKFPLSGFVDLKQVRELIKVFSGGRPNEGPNGMIFNMVSPFWEKADLAMLALDTGDGLKLTLVAHSPDATAAQGFKGSLEGLIAMGKGMLPLVKAEASKLDMLKPGLGAQLYGDLEKAVSALSVTQNGTMTIVKFTLPQQTLATITATLVPLIEKSQEAARMNRGINNLKMIALSLHNFHDTYRTFPAAARMKKEGNPPHSWRVAILPFIEENELFRQYNFEEPWDSENNKKILAKMPDVYRSPHADPQSTNTSYVVPILDKGIFSATPMTKGPGIATIKDGTSQTIAIIETETSIPWTKPEDLPIDPSKPLPALGFAKNPALNVAFADGSVQRLIKTPTIELLLPFLTASGGDTGDMGKLIAPSPGAFGPPPGRPSDLAPPPLGSETTTEVEGRVP
jgi:prepilin-type processing-associated H-X9-DG protein